MKKLLLLFGFVFLFLPSVLACGDYKLCDPELPGCVLGDCRVLFERIEENYGQVSGCGDLNRDGVVDLVDFGRFGSIRDNQALCRRFLSFCDDDVVVVSERNPGMVSSSGGGSGASNYGWRVREFFVVEGSVGLSFLSRRDRDSFDPNWCEVRFGVWDFLRGGKVRSGVSKSGYYLVCE